jgi:hypothetical protein
VSLITGPDPAITNAMARSDTRESSERLGSPQGRDERHRHRELHHAISNLHTSISFRMPVLNSTAAASSRIEVGKAVERLRPLYGVVEKPTDNGPAGLLC